VAQKRLVIGISGASGVIHGIRLLEVLKSAPQIETHLVISSAASKTILQETDFTLKEVEDLASVTHRFRDIGASIASGSFRTMGMVVIPCSMKTLSGVAQSFSDNLMLRAADVVLKDRRRLVLVTRETPLHMGHLRLMLQVTEMGGIIMPPMPAFYHRPKTLDDILNQTINRVLDLFDIDLGYDLFQRWQGMDEIRARRSAESESGDEEPGGTAG
jgi:4-hydroxy-3-polyprenylbenzoate decarboxylase